MPYISPCNQSCPSYYQPLNNNPPTTQESIEGKRMARVRRASDGLPRAILRPAHHRRAVSMEHKPHVRFDSSFEHVRTFYKDDSPSQLTSGLATAATCSIHSGGISSALSSSSGSPPEGSKTASTWFPRHEQMVPSKDDLATRNVHLEKLDMAPDGLLRGSVLVKNLTYVKSVICRFTLDGWATFSDVCASYASRAEYDGEPEGFDRFDFSIKLSRPGDLGAERIILCVCFTCNGQSYWDNNNGANYSIPLAKQTASCEEGPLRLENRPPGSNSTNPAQNTVRTLVDDLSLKITKPQIPEAKTSISFKQPLRAKQLPMSIRNMVHNWPSLSENHFLNSGWNEISCGK